jgi:phosphohistidine swiveling domain-containing protein
VDEYIVWLSDAGAAVSALAGVKGARLAAMAKAGFPVPVGFCVTTRSHEQAPPILEEAIRAAYRRLGGGAVAVRSSATAEDLATASFAGQQDTFLNVRGEEALIDAVRRCRESLWTERAAAYRRERSPDQTRPRMAVLVQVMIATDVAGVAFSMDPLTGEQAVVIECAAGLGEGVVSGSQEVERYSASRPGLLDEDQARRLTDTVRALETLFGGPQDVEWGYSGGKLYVFQSRPITAAATGFFTEALPNDDRLWTSGFLNERFPLPVSPLGWTLIRELLEPLAFRDPLRFIGYRWPAEAPVTKLHGGRPFVNFRVFQILYKPIPDCLLPEDASRYFPAGDTTLRRQAPYPRGRFDPRLIVAVLWNFLHDPANWSPFHNYRVWEKFTARHDQAMAALHAGADNPADAWTLMEQAQALNVRLLAIHRWSLTHADLFYSLLRRMLAAWVGDASVSAGLVTGLPNKSVELNHAMAQARTEADWDAFFERYGHRSFSLDIFRPTLGETRDEVRALAAGMDEDRQGGLSHGETGLGAWRGRLLNFVLLYARRYMRLREDQRFYWQKTLALQRRLALSMGRRLLPGGDIFFATMDELRAAAAGTPLPAGEIERRREEFLRIETDYPLFLRGREPLADARAPEGDVLRGRPVSPGIARGPVRILLLPADLGRLRPGDILVTRGADPGWTVVFGRIAGMVLEVGGQLSHGAVVAREYGIPAVAGIQDATRVLGDGQQIVLDGTSGLVRVLKE